MTKISEVVDFDAGWYLQATEDEKKTFRDWLLGVLKMHKEVSISFKKLDGTNREMICTLHEEIIPKIKNEKNSDFLCTVWDIELNAWRSFHFEKIQKIDFQI